jgi:hypothetical protein
MAQSKVRQFLAERQAAIPVREMPPGYPYAPAAPPYYGDDPRIRGVRSRQRDFDTEDEEEQEREEAEERRTIRRMRREAERAQLSRQLERLSEDDGGRRGGGSDITLAVQQAVGPLQEELRALRQASRDDAVLQGIREIAQGLKSNGTPQESSEDLALKRLDSTFGLVGSVIDRVKTMGGFGAPASSGEAPTMTRAQVLQQLAIEEETALRKADLKDRLDQREWEKDRVREEAAQKRAQTETMFKGIQEIAVPALGAIFGEQVVNSMMQHAAGESNAGMLPPGGSAPSAPSAPQAPMLRQWQCANCGSLNASEIGRSVVTCSNCGATGGLMQGPPPNGHSRAPVPPHATEEEWEVSPAAAAEQEADRELAQERDPLTLSPLDSIPAGGELSNGDGM